MADEAIALISVAVAMIVTAVVVYVVVRTVTGLLANMGGPAVITVTVLLALITLTTIVAFAFVQNDELVTLAGVGMGALAGAVTSVYSQRSDDGDDG